VEAKQLDEGIVDTFVSVGVKSGAHFRFHQRFGQRPNPSRAHLELLLDELLNLASFASLS